MNRYRCHKKVEAMKIQEIRLHTDRISATLFSEDDDHFSVDFAFLQKHTPQVGGYIVKYEDGYVSYSPAKAFEEGYTLIRERDQEAMGASA